MVETVTEEKVPLEAKNKPFLVCGFLGVFWNLSYGPEDHLGSTRMVLDENGGVKEALMYQPYGTVSDVQGITVAGTDPLRQKFTTKEFDEEGDENGAPGIKAYHFGFRVYDPDIGVWMSTDPADQYWNTYSYCGGDPVNFTDPDGAYVPVGVITALAGFAIGGYVGGVIGNNGELNPGKWENDAAWMIGAVAGFAAGGGIGWWIESGWIAALGRSIGTGVSAQNILMATNAMAEVANMAIDANNAVNVASGGKPNGVDAVTGAASVLPDKQKCINEAMKRGYSKDEAEQLYDEFQWKQLLQNAGLGGGPNTGGLKKVKDSYLKKKGIDAHALKNDYVPGKGGRYNISVDKVTKEAVLTPVQKGTSEIIKLGKTLEELAKIYPLGG